MTLIYIEYNDEKIIVDDWAEFGYIFLDDLGDEFNIQVTFAPFWLGGGKIGGESDDTIVYYMNLLSRNYFKNKLWKSMLFYISG